MKGGDSAVQGRLVDFRVDSVYHPEPAQVLMELHGSDLLQGRLIEILAGESGHAEFAVVEVQGLCQPVVIRTSSILRVL